MNRDRGVIKWTSMMLPEHVEKLKTLSKEQKKKNRPTIDDQVLEEWSRILAEAYSEGTVLSVTTFQFGYEKHFQGTVHRMDQVSKQLTLKGVSHSERYFIPFQDIIDITIAN